MTTATESAKTDSSNKSHVARIVVLDNLAQEGLDMLESAQGVEYEVHIGLSGEELNRVLQEFDGAVCRSGVKITADALQGNTRLKAITRAGVGTDNIDKQAATRLGIVVMNTPGGNTVSTAEQTFALMLGLSRNIAPAYSSLLEGKWDRKKFKGHQLQGKTLGVIGLGRIGQEVASRARAFGMTVLGFDPYLSDQQMEQLGLRPVKTIDEMLPEIDYLTVHTPLTDETRGLIGKQQLARIKPGAKLINCARGGIYDEEALVEGLKSGQLGGVALDVYASEPCTESPLFGLPGVLCTPHLGASTEEAQIQVAVEAVELLIKYLKDGEIRNAVNTIAMDPAVLEQIRGYLNVAYRLGMFLAGWHGGAIESVDLELEGEIAKQDPRILKSAFCAGLLAAAAENVNIVNAEAIASDRGIKIHTRTNPTPGAFAGVVAATVHGDGRSLNAGGTVFGKEMPRLVRLGGYRTDAFMDGNLLIFTHRDTPGVIGYVGNVLAEEQVNIAQMAVGRRDDTSGGPAIGVLNLDTPVSDEALEKVSQFEGMESVKLIRLPGRHGGPDWLS